MTCRRSCQSPNQLYQFAQVCAAIESVLPSDALRLSELLSPELADNVRDMLLVEAEALRVACAGVLSDLLNLWSFQAPEMLVLWRAQRTSLLLLAGRASFGSRGQIAWRGLRTCKCPRNGRKTLSALDRSCVPLVSQGASRA